MMAINEYAFEFPNEYANVWYSLPQKDQSAGGCWVVRAGHNTAKPSYCVGPKIISHYGFHWIIDGEVRVREGAHNVVLGKGDMFCLLPQRSYIYEEVYRPDSPPLQMIWLALDGAQMPWIISQLGLSRDSFWKQGHMDHEIWSKLRYILQVLSKGAADPMRDLGLIYDLLGRMKSKLEVRTQILNKNWLGRVKEYLEVHYTENIRIEDVSRLVGIHRSHVYVAFQRELGCSPMQYLQSLRMGKAAQMLKETSLSVTEIALTLGYPELYSFTRSFKKYFGISPKGYRK
jgi:AraC-like DNA-binding protein